MTEHPLTKFIPNLITLMSLIAGISSIKFSIQSNYKIAVLMIMLAAFFDFFDGWMARKLNAIKKYGTWEIGYNNQEGPWAVRGP